MCCLGEYIIFCKEKEKLRLCLHFKQSSGALCPPFYCYSDLEQGCCRWVWALQTEACLRDVCANVSVEEWEESWCPSMRKNILAKCKHLSNLFLGEIRWFKFLWKIWRCNEVDFLKWASFSLAPRVQKLKEPLHTNDEPCLPVSQKPWDAGWHGWVI